MERRVKIGNRWVGDGYPCYIIGEIGLNHNGDMEIAKKLIRAASEAGLDAVKFQKRTPELCVPKEQQGQMRETPWGYITYLDYRYKVEFGEEDYKEIDDFCSSVGMDWFASPWDELSVDFLEKFKPVCHKISSASLTDINLLDRLNQTGRPLILSTGMSTMEQIRTAVNHLGEENLLLMHTTSSYPCPTDELNLKMIQTLREEFNCPIGYSGHEVGLVTSVVAVALGASIVERHITLNRAMWGSDQAASVEPVGLRRLVKDIRVTEEGLGDGVKKVYETEYPIMKKLRRA
ncbi:MAG: N-acetylneuraminate synthase family protein [Anaerolineaceae bacterium]|nr:N-acetylneuraminate synthase family protein [Anaerolineaceae bacterium]